MNTISQRRDKQIVDKNCQSLSYELWYDYHMIRADTDVGLGDRKSHQMLNRLNLWKKMEQLENWCQSSIYGKQYGDFSKNQKYKLHKIPLSLFWVFSQRISKH